MATYEFIGTIKAEQPLATCSKDLKDREGEKDKPIPVPSMEFDDGTHLVFPASGLRGKFRRCGRDVLRDAIIEKTGNNKPFSLDQHYLLTLGGVKGKGEQDRSTVAEEAVWRERNPLLSLFGAGDAGALGFMSGRLGVGSAVSQKPVQPVIFDGARTDDFYRDKSQVQYLSDDDLDALVSRAQGTRDKSLINKEIKSKTAELRAAKKVSKEKADALQLEIDALNAEVEAVKQDTGATDVSIALTLAGWQAIPAGTIMDHRMLINLSNPVELGFMLSILNRFALFPVIGAHYANGNGLVSGGWTVNKIENDMVAELGSVQFDAMRPLNIAGDELQAALAAFKGWLASDIPNLSIPHAIA